MMIEKPYRIAHPSRAEWHDYERLFDEYPNVKRILELLRIQNRLEVKRCLKLFGPRTVARANLEFRRAGYDVRLCATPETVNRSLHDQVIHLYEIRHDELAPKPPA